MYKIITDGACDLYEEIVHNLNIQVVPFYVATNGDNHKKEIEEIGIREFYQFMVDNPKVFPKTSMPSIQDYLDVFTPLVKAGTDILCLCITTKVSGSYNAAMNARNMLLDDYPDAKIEVIDSTLATCLQGMLVEEAVKKMQSGATLEETVDYVNQIKQSGRIFFTIDGMDYLVHGGRVGKLSGIAAGALGIKPIVILKEGEIFSNGVTRGRKKAKKQVIDHLISYLKENNLDINDYRICVGYGYDGEEIKEFQKQVTDALKETFGIDIEVPIRQIGATIGVHTGPHPIGVGLIKKFQG